MIAILFVSTTKEVVVMLKSLSVSVLCCSVLAGCIEFKGEVSSVTPSLCTHIVSGYQLKITSKDSIIEATNKGAKVRNEVDGKVIMLTPELESQFACDKIGDEIKY